MSKEGTSKLMAGGRRALVTLGLKRRSTPVPFGTLAGLALVVGAVFALPRARKAWAHLKLRRQPTSDEPSVRKGTGANGARAAAEGAPPPMEGPEDEVERAENEGMHPGRW